MALLIAALPIVANAVTSETFKGIKEALYPSWQRWNNRCEPTVPPSTLTEASVKAYGEQYDRYMGCLATTYRKVQQRTAAEPLVNPEVWKELSPEQKRELDAGLAQANQAILVQLEAAYQAEQAQGKPVSDAVKAAMAQAKAQAEQPQRDTGASEAEVRACAKRYQKLDDADARLDSEQADIKSLQFQQTMMETRLIGMRATASASDYNRAVGIYQSDSQQLTERINRYNAKRRSASSSWSSYDDDCRSLHFSAKTREAVCGDGDYRAYCGGVSKRQ